MFRKKFFVLTLTVLMAMMLMSCGNISSPKSVTETFFSSIKDGDLDTAIECVDPSIQEKCTTAISVYKVLFHAIGFNIDSNELLDVLLEVANTYVFSNYDFKVTDSFKTDDTHALVTVEVYIDGEMYCTLEIQCVKINNQWYIEGGNDLL